jgi:hypothetical protein
MARARLLPCAVLAAVLCLLAAVLCLLAAISCLLAAISCLLAAVLHLLAQLNVGTRRPHACHRRSRGDRGRVWHGRSRR